MKTILLSVVALFATISTLSAQKIKGTVANADGSAAGFATVMLYNTADSALVKGAITDDNGQYEFEQIPSGHYFINVQLLGSGNGAAPVFDYNGGDKIIEKVTLRENTEELTQVTVVARRPLVEVRADKTVLNVEGNLNSQGQNALELLRKAPGVGPKLAQRVIDELGMVGLLAVEMFLTRDGDLLVNEIRQVDGVAVEDIRPVAPERLDGALGTLATATAIVSAAPAQRLQVACDQLRDLLDGDWASALDPVSAEPVASSGAMPDLGWLAAFLAGSDHLEGEHAHSPGDLAWAKVPRHGITLVCGRSGRVFHAREREEFRLLGAIVDAIDPAVVGVHP